MSFNDSPNVKETMKLVTVKTLLKLLGDAGFEEIVEALKQEIEVDVEPGG